MNTKIDPSSIDPDKHAILWIEGHNVYIDREDICYVYAFSWHVKYSLHYKYVYRAYVSGGKVKHAYMHRELTGCPKNKCVHHINYCGLDNRRENLLVMTPAENHVLHNRSTRPKKFPM